MQSNGLEHAAQPPKLAKKVRTFLEVALPNDVQLSVRIHSQPPEIRFMYMESNTHAHT